MSSGIVVTIFLPGALSGPVKHTTFQKGVVDVSPIGSKKPNLITKKIKHTDRTPLPCARIIPIDGNIVNFWITGDCPSWEKLPVSKKMNKDQRIRSYLSRLDEGYGFQYE